MSNLKKALNIFISCNNLDQLAAILEKAIHKKRISYDEIIKVVGNDPEDVLLTANEWGLLYPVRTSKSASWEDRILFAMPDEMYEMPNVVRHLVKNAIQTGRWDLQAYQRTFSL